MNLFYCPTAILNEYVTLDENESQHLLKVLRKKEGEELFVFDGKGNLFDARLTGPSKKEATIHIVRLIEVEANDRPKLHLALAPPKLPDRLEWLVEKATELGVAEITPINCQRSERTEIRADRLEKIILSASKQSLRLRLPRLNPMTKLEELIKSTNNVNEKFIAWCDKKPVHLKQVYPRGYDALILIGPEGDFTVEEILLAEQNDFETVSLGKNRLRLETAAIYAAAIFNLMNE